MEKLSVKHDITFFCCDYESWYPNLCQGSN